MFGVGQSVMSRIQNENQPSPSGKNALKEQFPELCGNKGLLGLTIRIHSIFLIQPWDEGCCGDADR